MRNNYAQSVSAFSYNALNNPSLLQSSPSSVMSTNGVLATHLAQVDANRRKITAMVRNLPTHTDDEYEVIAASGPMFLDNDSMAGQTSISEQQKRSRLDISALP